MPDDYSFEEINETIGASNPEALLADGFEDALVGYVEKSVGLVALYDKEKCIRILMKRDGMSYESAYEFFEFNVADAYVGEFTPVFATILRKA